MTTITECPPMNKDSQIAKILYYLHKKRIIWRSIKATRNNTLILEALETEESSPFRIIKLYKNNDTIICAFITLAGEVSIISSNELNHSEILNELCKIAKKHSVHNIEVKSLKNIASLDDAFDQELFTYYYLKKEQERRQRYRQTIVMMSGGFSIFCIFFVISLTFMLKGDMYTDIFKIANLIFLFFIILILIFKQYQLYKEVKASILNITTPKKNKIIPVPLPRQAELPRQPEKNT